MPAPAVPQVPRHETRESRNPPPSLLGRRGDGKGDACKNKESRALGRPAGAKNAVFAPHQALPGFNPHTRLHKRVALRPSWADFGQDASDVDRSAKGNGRSTRHRAHRRSMGGPGAARSPDRGPAETSGVGAPGSDVGVCVCVCGVAPAPCFCRAELGRLEAGLANSGASESASPRSAPATPRGEPIPAPELPGHTARRPPSNKRYVCAHGACARAREARPPE